MHQDRFKCLVWYCVCAFVRRLLDVFDTLINIKETITYIHGFFVLLIRCSWSFPSLSLSYIFEIFSSLFDSLSHVHVTSTLSYSYSSIEEITDLIVLLMCFVPNFFDSTFWVCISTCFLLLSSLKLFFTRKY